MARRKMAVEEPKVETMEDLKAATDKYFAIRDVSFDLLELFRVVNIFTQKRKSALIRQAGLNEIVETSHSIWNESSLDENVALDQITQALTDLEVALIGLARTKHEHRDDSVALPPLMSDSLMMATFTLAKKRGINV